MPEIVPSSRWITALLIAGLLALIIYGAINRDPMTFVIAGALALVLAPVTIITWLNRRAPRNED